jgi:hypothetical protein
MTTLTVYFALSPSATLTSSYTVQPFPMIANPRKVIPPLSPTIPVPAAQPAPMHRKPSKRNRTFFERFSQPSSSSTTSTNDSPLQLLQQHSSDPSVEPASRLRRRFTFRRSLRQSVHRQTMDADDGIRLQFSSFSSSCFFSLRTVSNPSSPSGLISVLLNDRWLSIL